MSSPVADPIALARENWEREGWAEAAEGMVAVTSVMRAQQIFQARVDEVLRPFGLTFARYELLMLLHFSSRGSMPLKKASERLQVHPTSITNAVDRLEAAGLVTRSPHPTDGRATLIAVTDEGRRTALKATDVLNAEVFARPGLAPRRLTTLVNVLEDLRRGAGDF
ncbi:MAG: MarR family transcriptional regulator [Frankiales bacterium]|jgi:DNA-binding MarR family transcriptional regulator|nr:MarR family transcriptional regulator [Frankiales bacterium]